MNILKQIGTVLFSAVRGTAWFLLKVVGVALFALGDSLHFLGRRYKSSLRGKPLTGHPHRPPARNIPITVEQVLNTPVSARGPYPSEAPKKTGIFGFTPNCLPPFKLLQFPADPAEVARMKAARPAGKATVPAAVPTGDDKVIVLAHYTAPAKS